MLGKILKLLLLLTPVAIAAHEFASLLTTHHMNLVFNTFELITIVLAVMMTSFVVHDGESNWLEGAQLLSAYTVMAVAFYLYP